MEENNTSKKVKTTLYMTKEDEQLLYEIIINRLKNDNKTDRSSPFCEGIQLLHERKVTDANSKK